MQFSFIRTQNSDKSIIKKCKAKPSTTRIKGGKGLADKIELASNLAKTKLNKYVDEYIVIRELEELEDYAKCINDFGFGAIDTETTGLNPMNVNLAGICLYVPGRKAAYVPINHKSHITGVRINKQLTEQDVYNALSKYQNIKWIMHNAGFDVRVLRHTCKLYLNCYWDTRLGSCCIDETESHKLKDLHIKYCDSKDTESLTFDKLFGGITFDNFPIDTAYLYAAGDAIKTYELYEYQKTILNRRTLPGPYNVFKNIEMPLVDVVCDMEDRGVCLDFDFANKLSKKYNKLKQQAYKEAYEALEEFNDLIENYKMRHTNNKLSNPISFTSPTQLAILFYDIFKLESPDKRKARGTGEDILVNFSKIQKYNKLCLAILKIREIEKLITTYIDKLPEVAHTDGRIHAKFNQYGAKTGRFSSSEPNLQNIPSHNKEIRQMFKAQDGYVLIGADYSQQEPMVTAYLSQDEKMMKAFIEGKDIYATIASLAFHKDYDNCLEFRSDGSTNQAGKERRTRAKSIVLGILYGRQIPSIAEQLGVDNREAQNIYNSVLKAFPQLAQFIKQSQQMAKDFGFVDTAWGRRRHLKDMQLEEYEFSYDDNTIHYDPLDFTGIKSLDVPQTTKQNYINRLKKCFSWVDKKRIIDCAAKEGIRIKNNGGFISQAERQCVNSRVQGSAADMIKLAMIMINNDEILKQLDFHLILQVHDEVIGECPKENRLEAESRLAELMKAAPSDKISLPFKCDTEVTNCWYGEKI